jgi:hypothetical protein
MLKWWLEENVSVIWEGFREFGQSSLWKGEEGIGIVSTKWGVIMAKWLFTGPQPVRGGW